jgi:hypothetical protein
MKVVQGHEFLGSCYELPSFLVLDSMQSELTLSFETFETMKKKNLKII